MTLFRGENATQMFNWPKLAISGVSDHYMKYGRNKNKCVRVRVNESEKKNEDRFLKQN